MIINDFWLVVMMIMIMMQIYLLFKYISNKNSIFNDNKFAAFVNGILFYFFLSFVVFLPFILLKVNILYLVIVFWIKEIITLIFLITRQQKYFEWKSIKEYLFLIIGGIIIALIWHYGIKLIVNPVEEAKNSDFNVLFILNDVISNITSADLDVIKEWATTFIISFMALGTVLALLKEYIYSLNYFGKGIGFALTLGIIILFSYNLPLWENGEVFISLFLILTSIRLISYSRKRYGFAFGAAAFASFAIGGHLRLGLWVIVIITMIVYTYLKKPKNSLFWVMLVSPLLIIEAINLYSISNTLSIIMIVVSVISFIFILSLQSASAFETVNTFFEKHRLIIPIFIFLSIFISSLTVIFLNDIDWFNLVTLKTSLIYSFTDNHIVNIIVISLIAITALWLLITVLWKVIKKKKIKKTFYINVVSLLIILLIFNPLSDALFSTTVFSSDIKYIASLSFIPLLVIGANKIIEYKKIEYS